MLDACPHHHEEETPVALPAEARGSAAASPPASLRDPRSAGTRWWRSISELEQSPEFFENLHRELPVDASVMQDPVSRRNFLKVTGATLALAGMAGCRKRVPDEAIVPYVDAPAGVVPGKPLFFASAVCLFGHAHGVLVEQHEGRPTKIEGNPDHPTSRGRTNIWMQASILDLYDPDRAKAPVRTGDASTVEAFNVEILAEMEKARANGGGGIRLLFDEVASPTLDRQLGDLLKAYPNAKICAYSPTSPANTRAGTRQAFGRDVNVVYNFDRAKVVVALDSDFLYEGPSALRHARDFIAGRQVRGRHGAMNRLYAAEAMPTITGAMADHRWGVKPSEVPALAAALASKLGVQVPAGAPAAEFKDLDAVVEDLRAAGSGNSIVIAGESQPAIVHALALAINNALGNLGKTVVTTAPVAPFAGLPIGTLADLTNDLNAGSVELLFVFGANPVYDAPADLDFHAAMGKARLRVQFGTHVDETSAACHWNLPAPHYLEAWSDLRAFDGTVSVVQPLIEPLYGLGTRSVHEVLNVLLGTLDKSGYETVRETWQTRAPGAAFEPFWRDALNKGVIPGTEAAAATVAFAGLGDAKFPEAASTGIELALRPDPTVWDGRWANNGWLQELPKPVTKMTWDNAAYVSRKTAKELGIGPIHERDGYPEVDVTLAGRTIRVPVVVQPAHADGVVTIHLGYGRTRGGNTLMQSGDAAGLTVKPRGSNAYVLRTGNALAGGGGADVKVSGGSRRLASTQTHQIIKSETIEGLVRVQDISGFEEKEHELREENEHRTVYPLTLYNDQMPSDPMGITDGKVETFAGTGEHGANSVAKYRPGSSQWGMAIDNNACIGCNACVMACNSENNIPVVGKEQVLVGREMHWLRIDTYYRSNTEDSTAAAPEAVDGPYFNPMLCQHCEKAPCELVCPVTATSHSHEGVNEMTYNRCVGTRYCSNNCPWKVRHFNFLAYQDDFDKGSETIKMMRNPDVTVRYRGVMEKCNYCVQRINHGRIDAERVKATLASAADGAERDAIAAEAKRVIDSVQTACQQACPTDAIVFGNINDPTTKVNELKVRPGDYVQLEELNTRPRTSYLPRFTNHNPKIAIAKNDGGLD